ncbi:MAG: DUF1905 domain-containing protein [bacterium]|nr:DUF1905 domain-containing protein [bacterium]
MDAVFTFECQLFEEAVEAAWVFAALPLEVADEIVELVPRRRGFGSVRVTAQIGTTTWQTSIFPSKALMTYVLPVKRAVRKQEQIHTGDDVIVTITLAE